MIDRQGSIRNILGRLNKGFKEELGRGREDYRQALKRGYANQGKDTEQTMIDQMMGSNRTVTLMRELAGKADPTQVAARNDMNIGLSSDKWETTWTDCRHVSFRYCSRQRPCNLVAL